MRVAASSLLTVTINELDSFFPLVALVLKQTPPQLEEIGFNSKILKYDLLMCLLGK